MPYFDERNYDDWDDADKMAFALAGLSNVATRALHEGLCPGPRGWTSDYPERLLKDLDFWTDKIRELKTANQPGKEDK